MTAVSTRSDASRRELAGDALGLPSVLFCIVTGAAPLAATLFNVPVARWGVAIPPQRRSSSPRSP